MWCDCEKMEFPNKSHAWDIYAIFISAPLSFIWLFIVLLLLTQRISNPAFFVPFCFAFCFFSLFHFVSSCDKNLIFLRFISFGACSDTIFAMFKNNNSNGKRRRCDYINFFFLCWFISFPLLFYLFPAFRKKKKKKIIQNNNNEPK